MLTSAIPVVPLTTAATPTIAQSWARRLNFWNDHPAPGHLRHPHLDQHLVRLQGSLEEPSEEIDRGDLPPAVGPLGDKRASEGQDGGGKIRGRIAMGQRAAERATVAHLGITNLVGGIGQQGNLLFQQRRRLEVMVARQGPDGDLVTTLLDVRKVRDLSDVDEHRRDGESQLHQAAGANGRRRSTWPRRRARPAGRSLLRPKPAGRSRRRRGS